MKQNPEGTGPKSISLERKMQRKKLSDSYHFALIIHQTLADHFPKFVVKNFNISLIWRKQQNHWHQLQKQPRKLHVSVYYPMQSSLLNNISIFLFLYQSLTLMVFQNVLLYKNFTSLLFVILKVIFKIMWWWSCIPYPFPAKLHSLVNHKLFIVKFKWKEGPQKII